MTHAPDGSVVNVGPRTVNVGPRTVNVGRKTRTIPPAIRRALDHRDAGCRFPGCGLKFCDAHHIDHWADGGETKLDNLILLCRLFRIRNNRHYSDSRIIPILNQKACVPSRLGILQAE
jgi:5-methylcytosine-specific restriction endonuclease McrA